MSRQFMVLILYMSFDLRTCLKLQLLIIIYIFLILLAYVVHKIYFLSKVIKSNHVASYILTFAYTFSCKDPLFIKHVSFYTQARGLVFLSFHVFPLSIPFGEQISLSHILRGNGSFPSLRFQQLSCLQVSLSTAQCIQVSSIHLRTIISSPLSIKQISHVRWGSEGVSHMTFVHFFTLYTYQQDFLRF